jgi:hypothetical protein
MLGAELLPSFIRLLHHSKIPNNTHTKFCFTMNCASDSPPPFSGRTPSTAAPRVIRRGQVARTQSSRQLRNMISADDEELNGIECPAYLKSNNPPPNNAPKLKQSRTRVVRRASYSSDENESNEVFSPFSDIETQSHASSQPSTDFTSETRTSGGSLGISGGYCSPCDNVDDDEHRRNPHPRRISASNSGTALTHDRPVLLARHDDGGVDGGNMLDVLTRRVPSVAANLGQHRRYSSGPSVPSAASTQPGHFSHDSNDRFVGTCRIAPPNRQETLSAPARRASTGFSNSGGSANGRMVMVKRSSSLSRKQHRRGDPGDLDQGSCHASGSQHSRQTAGNAVSSRRLSGREATPAEVSAHSHTSRSSDGSDGSHHFQAKSGTLLKRNSSSTLSKARSQTLDRFSSYGDNRSNFEWETGNGGDSDCNYRIDPGYVDHHEHEHFKQFAGAHQMPQQIGSSLQSRRRDSFSDGTTPESSTKVGSKSQQRSSSRTRAAGGGSGHVTRNSSGHSQKSVSARRESFDSGSRSSDPNQSRQPFQSRELDQNKQRDSRKLPDSGRKIEELRQVGRHSDRIPDWDDVGGRSQPSGQGRRSSFSAAAEAATKLSKTPRSSSKTRSSGAQGPRSSSRSRKSSSAKESVEAFSGSGAESTQVRSSNRIRTRDAAVAGSGQQDLSLAGSALRRSSSQPRRPRERETPANAIGATEGIHRPRSNSVSGKESRRARKTESSGDGSRPGVRRMVSMDGGGSGSGRTGRRRESAAVTDSRHQVSDRRAASASDLHFDIDDRHESDNDHDEFYEDTNDYFHDNPHRRPQNQYQGSRTTTVDDDTQTVVETLTRMQLSPQGAHGREAVRW